MVGVIGGRQGTVRLQSRRGCRCNGGSFGFGGPRHGLAATALAGQPGRQECLAPGLGNFQTQIGIEFGNERRDSFLVRFGPSRFRHDIGSRLVGALLDDMTVNAILLQEGSNKDGGLPHTEQFQFAMGLQMNPVKDTGQIIRGIARMRGTAQMRRKAIQGLFGNPGDHGGMVGGGSTCTTAVRVWLVVSPMRLAKDGQGIANFFPIGPAQIIARRFGGMSHAIAKSAKQADNLCILRGGVNQVHQFHHRQGTRFGGRRTQP